MDQGFHGDLEVRALGRLHWITLKPLLWVDPQGRQWVAPAEFGTDLRSSVKAVYWYAPPAIGAADRAWVIHDFHARCCNLLGLSRREIDLALFPQSLRDLSKSRLRAATHGAVVYAAWLATGRRGGDGWHGSRENPDKYDTPIIAPESGQAMNLDAWVNANYEPGLGYQGSMIDVLRAASNQEGRLG